MRQTRKRGEKIRNVSKVFILKYPLPKKKLVFYIQNADIARGAEEYKNFFSIAFLYSFGYFSHFDFRSSGVVVFLIPNFGYRPR